MIKKMKNGVHISRDHMQGYGSSDQWKAHFFFQNRTLEKKKFESCCDEAVWVQHRRHKYRRLSVGQLVDLTKDAPQAFQVCDQCLKPLIESITYQSGLQRCGRCSDKTPYTEVGPIVEARASARMQAQLEAERRARSIKEQDDGTTED